MRSMRRTGRASHTAISSPPISWSRRPGSSCSTSESPKSDRATILRATPPWHGIVDKHWNVEVAIRKGLRDVRQMPADIATIGSVRWIIGLDLDHATVRLHKEMVCRSGLRKAHSFFAFAAVFHLRSCVPCQTFVVLRFHMGIVQRTHHFGASGLLPLPVRRLLTDCASERHNQTHCNYENHLCRRLAHHCLSRL